MIFRGMRIIDYRIIDVLGIGRIAICYDLQTQRSWAKKYIRYLTPRQKIAAQIRAITIGGKK